ncbi:UbiD family decarboxylase [Stetteria hydrogenophila]
MASDGGLARFLEAAGFERVEGEVEPEYGVTMLLAGGGGPLVFRVRGAPLDAGGNVVSARERVLQALGASSDAEAYEKLLRAMSSPEPLRFTGAPTLREAPRGLLDAPAVRFYEGEGGPYLTASVFIACWRGVCNASVHRVMVKGERVGVVRVVPRHLWRLYREAVGEGRDLPVTVVLGVHPAVLLAAASSPRLGVFELGVASALLGGLEVYESPVHGNPVPAGAGVVVEGWLTRETAPEGPFVDATGTLDKVREQPALRVEAAYYNPDGVSHVILPAGREHLMLMGFPREAQVWEAVSRVVPRVHAVRLTPASGGWLHAVIAIEKNHDGDAKNAILAAFAGHPSLKHVVVVSPDIDVDDPGDVEWAIATRFQADRDLVVVREARGSTLDPSAPEGFTTKLGLDATKPLGGGVEYEKATRIPGRGLVRVR